MKAAKRENKSLGPRTVAELPDTMPFTKEDQERLEWIRDFLEAMFCAFDVGEVGHQVDYITISGLLRPGYEMAEKFCDDISERFGPAMSPELATMVKAVRK